VSETSLVSGENQPYRDRIVARANTSNLGNWIHYNTKDKERAEHAKEQPFRVDSFFYKAKNSYRNWWYNALLGIL